MKIKLSLYASLEPFLKDRTDSNSCIVEMENGATVGDLLDHFQIPEEVPRIVFRNGVHTDRAALLEDGDEVGAFPPVAGG